MGRLDYSKATVAPGKIVRYLLDLSHPVGRSKAVFFLAFGFTAEEWHVMADAFLNHVADHDVVDSEATDDGVRYVLFKV